MIRTLALAVLTVYASQSQEQHDRSRAFPDSSHELVCSAEVHPKILFKPESTYPHGFGRLRRVETVYIRCELDTAGRFDSVTVCKSTNKKLNAQALRLAKQYRFSPGEMAGRKVPVTVTFLILFRP